jgi:hydrogenase/urease accessory protein HupE
MGLALCAASLLLSDAAGAHRLAPALLGLEETPAGEVEVVWKLPIRQPVGSDFRPELPAHCVGIGTGEATRDATSVTLRSRVDCGETGLVGARVAVRGLAEGGSNALLRVVLRDGRRMQAVLHAGEPAFVVPERQSAWSVAGDYATLGFEHILSGLDHLAFVLGLVLLVSGRRLLLYTVTAFTLGHSVTLSLATLGFVRFPSALVEIVIAGTILALALELARPPPDPPSWMRRAPWLMAFAFGLLHGLGFAGALAEVGLPEEEIPLALLTFNLGIELGQLVFVAVMLALGWAIRATSLRLPGWALAAPAYALGGLAVFWCLDRAIELLAGPA